MFYAYLSGAITTEFCYRNISVVIKKSLN